MAEKTFEELLMADYKKPGTKIHVGLRHGEKTAIAGVFVTAQGDYLQVDDDTGRRCSIPFSAVSYVRPA
jgi:hypothetical protein